MNEVFDSEFINVEYRKDDDIVLVVLKGKVIRDDFRTPMMHAADMVLRHSCKIMAVDFGADLELSESDINWSKKILLSNLKKNGLEVLILIDSSPKMLLCSKENTTALSPGIWRTSDSTVPTRCLRSSIQNMGGWAGFS